MLICALYIVGGFAAIALVLIAAVLIDRWAGHHETELEAEDEK